MLILRKCPNCGKEFETPDKKNKTQTYCCPECYREHKGIGVKKYANCVICGKPFELINGRGTKVCSKECLGELRHRLLSKDKPKFVCENCGKEFTAQVSGTKPKFCSMECYHDYLRKNDVYRKRHAKISEAVREVRKCEMCGKEFEVYKKTKKRFCSDECRVKYSRTKEFRDKVKKTLMEHYGVPYVPSIRENVEKQIEKYKKVREEKYQHLCDISDMELLSYVGMHVLRVKCKKCGEEQVTNNLSYLPYEKIYCRNCSDEYKHYKPAIKLYEFLDSLGVKYTKNDRTIIKPYEIDIYLPDYQIGIEVNGNFWHSELCGKDKDYHIRKSKLSNDTGIKLIHIFEDEIEYKLDIVKSRLISTLGKSEKLYARKCSIRELTFKEKRDFLNETHIQGDGNSSINIGLFFSSELVSVMTFSNKRVIYGGKGKKDSDEYELIRFANKLNTTVVGGFSKLLKYFIDNYKPRVITTFCDVRWSGLNPEKTVYLKCGFEYQGTTKPNYWYMHKTDVLNRKHRYTFTKHAILNKHPELDSSKTEWELMRELGYNRIWDCGNMKFIMQL